VTGALAGNQAFRGTAVGIEAARHINPIVRRFVNVSKEFDYGPDFWSKVTRQAWDITKPWLVEAHVNKYVVNPPPFRPRWRGLIGLTYE
jgi:hypothetical protein